MAPSFDLLFFLLRAAALCQLSIAVLNLFLVKMLGWREELARVPLLMQEVFQVHAWFISITLTIFGAITWRFADEIARASTPLATWLAGGIGLFWLTRAVLQVSYYSSCHWRERLGRTLIHIALLIIYGGFAAIYLSTLVCQARPRHTMVQATPIIQAFEKSLKAEKMPTKVKGDSV
jgi:hypothetical protein